MGTILFLTNTGSFGPPFSAVLSPLCQCHYDDKRKMNGKKAQRFPFVSPQPCLESSTLTLFLAVCPNHPTLLLSQSCGPRRFQPRAGTPPLTHPLPWTLTDSRPIPYLHSSNASATHLHLIRRAYLPWRWNPSMAPRCLRFGISLSSGGDCGWTHSHHESHWDLGFLLISTHWSKRKSFHVGRTMLWMDDDDGNKLKQSSRRLCNGRRSASES